MAALSRSATSRVSVLVLQCLGSEWQGRLLHHDHKTCPHRTLECNFDCISNPTPAHQQPWTGLLQCQMHKQVFCLAFCL